MDTSVSSSRAQRGFTLLELMVACAVLLIMAALAASPLRDAFMNVRLSSAANDLMADLALARSEAIKRNVVVRLCPSDAGDPPAASNLRVCTGAGVWNVGWIVFVDDNQNALTDGTDNNGIRDNAAGELVLKTRPGVGTPLTVTPGPAPPAILNLPYRATGVISTTAVASTFFDVCDGRGAANPAEYRHTGRRITISPTGRAVVTRITC